MPIPPSAFDARITSGTIPWCSNEYHVPVRPQPVWISSTMSGMSSSDVTRRTPRTNSVGAGMTPPSACTISMIVAAGLVTPPLGSVRTDSK